jgi:hypothetical protein
MTDVAGDEPSFVWEVGQDLIDLDHWARTYIARWIEMARNSSAPTG